jgi:RimJ/RimL family protein N-acetyltransferase
VETYTLDTARLVLEQMTAEIATAVTTLTQQADWGRGFPAPGEVTVAHRVLEATTTPEPPFLTYVVRERSSGLLIGGAGFHAAPSERTAELGYGLSRAYQGYGYATEACRALVDAAFLSGAVDQIVATTDLDNTFSQGVLRRLAFTPTNELATQWVLSRP